MNISQQSENLKYWLALKYVAGLGNIGVRNLLQSFGTPDRIFRAPLHMLEAVPGIGTKTAVNIKDFNDWKRVEAELSRAAQQQITIMTCQDSRFPKRLLFIYDSPFLLYVRGELRAEDINIAVVGSRTASAYGKFTTERLSRELALNGVTVVSGMARGIDTAAHRGALAVKGRTIAVLGSGIDVIYPPENEVLAQEIALCGAVISEFSLGTPPNAPNFPARNRIISGMSLGVVVVEATEKSGSLITARIALEQGREVFAVPGSIDAAGSRGTNRLIKEGAKLIENVNDILDEIRPQVFRAAFQEDTPLAPSATPPSPLVPPIKEASQKKAPHLSVLGGKEETLIQNLSSRPRTVDELIAATGLTASDVLSALLQLELRGVIRQLPGNKYILQE
ncbi:MAG TPA: DNA-processing protein DprA [Syntrophales bacterium]|nr:DNA-processing protein DprA [Syntrophales bacterium]HQG35214.1 DNA-processing protein DprA [Syntrophales bacterium]HQI35170.1 DNA-processing protein DprA [Syntrophales bacterium]HQJ30879.1 DNA-processing protein DprA [Syntrophales bacterium]HRR46626.1 DNA-processing protein DprA [Syntrophales bacterium]